jgi:hypothetical protein
MEKRLISACTIQKSYAEIIRLTGDTRLDGAHKEKLISGETRAANVRGEEFQRDDNNYTTYTVTTYYPRALLVFLLSPLPKKLA